MGPATICIYIENIRFWFIISVAVHAGGGGGGGGGVQRFRVKKVEKERGGDADEKGNLEDPLFPCVCVS